MKKTQKTTTRSEIHVGGSAPVESGHSEDKPGLEETSNDSGEGGGGGGGTAGEGVARAPSHSRNPLPSERRTPSPGVPSPPPPPSPSPGITPSTSKGEVPRHSWTRDDVYLFNEGTHYSLWDKLGAHLVTEDGVAGVRFAVWAPNAEYVSVVGDFNGWNAAAHPLAALEQSGIWQGFIPDVGQGACYKYHIRSRHRGYRVDKADPFAAKYEEPPRTASVVWDLDYEWNDDEWMKNR